MAFGSSAAIGLDIGASAVRVAQVGAGRGGASLLSFASAPLPHGAVTDGEIRDAGPVAEAIAQVFKRAKVRAKSAVLGVANQRVVVRQVDLPYLEDKEFRSSLRFQAADHIPMSVEDAQLDFIVIEDYMTDAQDHMMRVLLIAAATDMVDAFVAAASSGGVEAAGVDLTPFAIARAVSPSARGEIGVAGSEAVIDVGAATTNILIHHNGEPRFVRILLVGGDDATSALSQELGISFEEAEAMKLDLGRGVGPVDARRLMERQVATLVDEVRGSLDYYLSQEDSEPVSSVILTGGGSLTAGLAPRLEQALRTQVQLGAPLSQVNASKSGLTPEQVAQVQPVAAAAVGLALGASRR
ncbi:MAG: type IV pilus assembly protein PilM [Actinomycetota bacterium]|nr:type IV pilus assembly protein PilM [Actinomycetota bacterium]